MPSGLERLRLGLRRDGADEEAEVVRSHGSADLGGALAIVVEQLARDLGRHQKWHVGVAAAPGPHGRLGAGGAGSPDGRMRLLKRQAPRVDVTEVVVAALPTERPRVGPALEGEVLALLATPAGVERGCVWTTSLHAEAPHKSGPKPCDR